MFEAISELKNDADNVTPKTPHLEGNLRGDYTFILEGITQSKVSEKSGGKGKDHHKGGEGPAERFGAKDIIAKIVFRQPYAAKWHEAVNKKVNWSEGGVGPKYLESKMMMFAKKYIRDCRDADQRGDREIICSRNSPPGFVTGLTAWGLRLPLSSVTMSRLVSAPRTPP